MLAELKAMIRHVRLGHSFEIAMTATSADSAPSLKMLTFESFQWRPGLLNRTAVAARW